VRCANVRHSVKREASARRRYLDDLDALGSARDNDDQARRRE
jgi:hypothetical protein